MIRKADIKRIADDKRIQLYEEELRKQVEDADKKAKLIKQEISNVCAFIEDAARSGRYSCGVRINSIVCSDVMDNFLEFNPSLGGLQTDPFSTEVFFNWDK